MTTLDNPHAETIEPTAAVGAFDVDALVRPDRVHGSVYTSPEIFRRELEQIFRKGWVYVAHDSEVPEPGDYITRMMGQEPVIVARGKDGQVRVLANRCAHRGNRLCNAEQGNATSFRCPYHGWTFSNEGPLVAVPMKNGYADRYDSLRGELGLTPPPAWTPTGVSSSPPSPPPASPSLSTWGGPPTPSTGSSPSPPPVNCSWAPGT